jgi:glutathione peroxidase
MFFSGRNVAHDTIILNETNAIPAVSFYDLKAIAINGDTIDFNQFKNKNVLIVNTASDCGYTAQYQQLEKLYQLKKDSLVIIGFPSNDFKEQEKADNKSIENFCKKFYGVTFLLIEKSSVLKRNQQHPVFQWLSNSEKNGWCNTEPTWNFCKFLINKNGVLMGFYGSSISPLDATISKSLD